jgi:hypothetical protein
MREGTCIRAARSARQSIFLGQIRKFLASLTLRRRHRSPRHALASLDVGESRSQQGPKRMPQPDHQRPPSVPSPSSNRSSMGRPSGRSTLHSSLTVCPTCRFERCLIRSTTRGRSPTCLFAYLERNLSGLGPCWVRNSTSTLIPRHSASGRSRIPLARKAHRVANDACRKRPKLLSRASWQADGSPMTTSRRHNR